MSGIVVWSDPHFSNHTAFAKEVPNNEFPGTNSRFKVIVDSFRKAKMYALRNDCEALIIPGDLFHERGMIQVPVYNAVYKLLLEAKEEKLPIYITAGNHDFVSQKAINHEDELHSLYGYREICTVVSDPQLFELDNFVAGMLPYNPNKEYTQQASEFLYQATKVSNKPNIVFYHHSFVGATTGPHEFRMKHELAVEELPVFDLSLSGHYHKHQTIGKLTYVGAPIQHNAGERTYIPGFMHVLPDLTTKFIEDTESPRFIVAEVSSEEELKKYRPQDYKVIRWQGEERHGENIRKNVDNCTVEIQPEFVRRVSRTDISTADTVEEMIKKYVVAKTGRQDADLISAGISLFYGKE